MNSRRHQVGRICASIMHASVVARGKDMPTRVHARSMHVKCAMYGCLVFQPPWHSLAPCVPTPWQKLEAMASSQNKRLPAPVAPGTVKYMPPPPLPPKKSKSSTGMASGSSTAQGSQEPWDPERVTDEPKSKNWWDRGNTGRRKK